MALQSKDLTDIGFGAGLTENFQVQYDSSLYDSLPSAKAAAVKANLIANANYLLSVVEASFTTTIGWFGTPASKFGTGQRQVVNLNKPDGSGANNSGYGSAINTDGQGNNGSVANAGPTVAMLWMNEWAEILMSLTNGQWNRGDSSGEGLSQYSGIELFQAGHYNYYNSWVDGWLNQQPLQDWVTKTEGTDGDAISFGGALAFIFYLQTQLGFSINQIIAAYSSNMANTYNALTGDPGSPYPFFVNLLQSVYPPSATANIPGPVFDNPFPIAEVSFWDEKNTFGKDEAQDIINTLGGLVSGAFWVVVEGFSKQSFNTLGVQVSAFSGTFFNLPGVKISPDPLGAQYENGVNNLTPQRIRIPFNITLSNGILNQFPKTGSATYGLSVSLNVGGTPVSGSSASTQFELLAGADPYFSNIDPNQGNLAYLSQDLRVFTATPVQNPFPIPGGPQLTDSVSGAFTYTKALLNYLNSNPSFTNPNGTDPFTTLFPDQSGANQTDSSVTPVTIDLSGGILNPKFDNNYSFAVARVRLRGPSGMAGEAAKVRVFFRLWSTQSNDTDYDANSTYRSTSDSSGHPGSPLVGSGNTTLPFFATGNLSSNTDYAAGGPNIQTLQIPSHQDSLWSYYGCFLNLYDPNNKINGAQVQTYLNGTHHCLVAQIAFDDAPIPQGVSPLSWDQLAQRNLQITLSDNPGPASTHRIPQTFDCRPSKAAVSPAGTRQALPDELMIDWGAIPVGSVASLFWPQVLAADVISLASQLYSSNPLAASDTHTIKLSVTGGVSYIPIPTGAGQNFAKLFTVDLPTTVRTGQEFNIMVRRISSRTIQPLPPPPSIQTPIQTNSMPSTFKEVTNTKKTLAKAVAPAPAKALSLVTPGGPLSWRYVVGTFQVRIPVTTRDKILPSEETTLAIMKWRLGQMSPSNRWYPVLERYIEYISARVDGLGGNAQAIPPSLSGIPPEIPLLDEEQEFIGKICEVRFDCHGDFEGFVLCDCCASRVFESRIRNVSEIALRACREQLLLSVYINRRCGNKISRLVVRQ